LLIIGGEIALLIAELALCGVLTAAPSPATVLCIITALCTFALLLATMADWVLHCMIYPNGADWVGTADEVIDTVQLITGICAVLGGGVTAWRAVIERGGGIKAIIDRLLRHFGFRF
jgi:hypothetical protein